MPLECNPLVSLGYLFLPPSVHLATPKHMGEHLAATKLHNQGQNHMHKKFWLSKYKAPLKDVCKPHKGEFHHNLKQLNSGG